MAARVPGWIIILVSAVLVLVLMFATAKFAEDVRPDYRIASAKQDAERTDVALTDARVAWLQDARPGGAVWVYDIASGERSVVEASAASLDHPVLMNDRWLAWVEGPQEGPHRVAVHDLANGSRSVLGGGEGQDLLLPGRTLDGDTLMVSGTFGEGLQGWWLVRLGTVSEPELLGPMLPSGPVALDGGLVWWVNGSLLVALDPARGVQHTIEAGHRIVDFSVDGDLVAWTEDLGPIRGVRYKDLATNATGPLSREAQGDQLQPAVNGTRAVFIQHEGLVRFVDLATGEERVLPARTQENIQLRLSTNWAAWLSGTLEGHNVMLVPVGDGAGPS